MAKLTRGDLVKLSPPHKGNDAYLYPSRGSIGVVLGRDTDESEYVHVKWIGFIKPRDLVLDTGGVWGEKQLTKIGHIDKEIE